MIQVIVYLIITEYYVMLCTRLVYSCLIENVGKTIYEKRRQFLTCNDLHTHVYVCKGLLCKITQLI